MAILSILSYFIQEMPMIMIDCPRTAMNGQTKLHLNSISDDYLDSGSFGFVKHSQMFHDDKKFCKDMKKIRSVFLNLKIQKQL